MACSACVKRKDVARPPAAKSTDELLSILLEVTTKEAVLTEKLIVTPKALDKIAAAPEKLLALERSISLAVFTTPSILIEIGPVKLFKSSKST